MDKKILEAVKNEMNILKENSEVVTDEREIFFKRIGAVSTFICGEGALIINSIEGNAAYIKVLGLLHKDDVISRNYTEQDLKILLVEYFASEKSNVREFIDNLNKINKEEYILFYPVVGVTVESSFKLMDVTFLTREELIERTQEMEEKKWGNIQFFEYQHFVEVSIKSSSKKRAIVIGREYLEKILNTIRFFMNSIKGNTTINYNSSNSVMNYCIALGGGNITINGESVANTGVAISLEEMSEKDKSTLEGLIGLEVTNRKKTEMEKRIAESIQWMGKANIEQELTMKFMKLCFALESLIQEKSLNQTERMSEVLAFILEDEKNDRIKMKNNFKYLYDLRSKIAHGSNEQILNYDLYLLHEYVRALLSELYTKKDVFKTLSDVQKYVENLKFS